MKKMEKKRMMRDELKENNADKMQKKKKKKKNAKNTNREVHKGRRKYIKPSLQKVYMKKRKTKACIYRCHVQAHCCCRYCCC